MEKKIGIALLVGGALLFFTRKASAAEADEPEDDEPEDDLRPDLCANNARRRDMTNVHGRDDLVEVESTGSQEVLHPEAAVAYNRLRDAARAAGFAAPLFTVVSGYRTLASQRRLFAIQMDRQRAQHPDWSQAQLESAAAIWVARPGFSDHETGCAVDLWLGYGITGGNNAAIRASRAYRWLAENAWRFGFCEYAYRDQSHPGEGWHWKYILRRVR